jgi:hypothetical protein
MLGFVKMNTPSEIKARFEQLFRHMGEALWCIQGLEQILAKYYVVSCKLSGKEPAEDIEEQFEQHFWHTLGRMVRIFKKIHPPDEGLNKRLDGFADDRNWLVHRLRRQDYLSLVNQDQFPRLIERVQKLGNEAQALIELFNEMMIDHFVRLGVDRKYIVSEMEKEYRRIMNRWAAGLRPLLNSR